MLYFARWRTTRTATLVVSGLCIRSRALHAPTPAVLAAFPPTPEAAARNADPDAVFVVTGASRGIGAELAAQLLERSRGRIVACCRDPARAEPRLKDLQAQHPQGGRLALATLDVTDDASIFALASSVGDRVDVLLNAAGVLHDGDRAPERSLGDVDRAWLVRNFEVNAAGPLLVTKALRKALAYNKNRPPSIVANVSARVGSISDNKLGGWYSYRASKAALNQATRTAAIELRRQKTSVVALHPGTTDTDLSKPFQKNIKKDSLFDRAFTATQLLTIVDGVKLDAHSGFFFAWDGQPIDF